MYDDEFENTFGYSGEDAGLSEDEMDDMLWREEMKQEKECNNKQQTQGCFVATCVYGSYDCPEVWTLLIFRDYTLSRYFFGRIFIKFYYAVSPKIVKLFGNEKWFKSIFKKVLDKMVLKLHLKGVKSSPYKDINW